MSAAEKEAPRGSGGAAQSDHDQVIVPADTAPGKRLATLAAKLALKGYSLHATAGGVYIVARWDRSVVAADLDAVEGFLARAGGQP